MTPAEEARFIALWNAGTMASAVRMLAKAELTGNLGRILPTSERSEETLLGNLTSEEGIGWPRPRPWASSCSNKWFDLTEHSNGQI
jgi:hypothetical protein